MNTLCYIAKTFTEIIFEVFNHSSNSNKTEEFATYDYWMTLDYKEQYEYFTSNEYLKDYIANDYYSCDRHLTALHVQKIADKLNKEFTNKYNRY